MPKRKRPPLKTSSAAACLATEHGLALGQDDNAGDEFDFFVTSRETAEQNQGLVERVIWL